MRILKKSLSTLPGRKQFYTRGCRNKKAQSTRREFMEYYSPDLSLDDRNGHSKYPRNERDLFSILGFFRREVPPSFPDIFTGAHTHTYI